MHVRLILFFYILINTVSAQHVMRTGYLPLEINVVDSRDKLPVQNAYVYIRDTSSNIGIYLPVDSIGYTRVLLPENKVYELMSLREDYFDSESVYILLNSNIQRVSLYSEEIVVYKEPAFSAFNRVYFEKASSVLTDSIKVVLDSFCNAVASYKYILVFEVRGNTRASKNEKLNFDLSELRAKSVAEYLRVRTFNCVFITKAQSHYKLINDCTGKKCTEAELSANDRVDISIIAARTIVK